MAGIGDGKRQDKQRRSGNLWLKRFAPLFGITGVLIAFAVIYLSYDYVSAKAQPCETIFRQTSVGLSTKISFLKTQGELQIGREPLVELGERAQMTALNLKTCCTVLDAGKLDPEQFLQCKSDARAYEAKVEDIVAVVQQVTSKAGGGDSAKAGTEAPAADAAVVAPEAKQAKAKITEKVAEARAVSKAFNKTVLKVRKAQALETLELIPPKHVDVGAQESEPNNDGLNTNRIKLDTWVTGGVQAAGDLDFYTFTTPPKHRDWITIELENRSTSLEPYIEFFNANKARLDGRHNTTRGANLKYSFVSAPEKSYVFRVGSYYGKSTGAYLVRVVANKSYDVHEPNQGILEATAIQAGKAIDAGIMDGGDSDFYRVEASKPANKVTVKVTNRSTTLRPFIALFNADKAAITNRHNTTGGSDVTLTKDVAPGTAFYIQVKDYYGDKPGEYQLQVDLTPAE